MAEDNAMTEREKWQTRIGIAGLAAAILTPSITFYIYIDRDDAQQNAQETAAISERKEALWEDRKKVYDDLSKNLGSIAMELDNENEIPAELRNKFSEAYWAQLPRVASDEVEQEMVKFRNDLRDFDEGMIESDKLKWRIVKINTLTAKHLSPE